MRPAALPFAFSDWIGDGVRFLDRLVHGGGSLVNIAAEILFADVLETRRRKNSPLHFDQVLSQSAFTQMVREIAAKDVPRVVDVVVSGMTITLRVASNSGLSTWTTEIDFNDYGHLTGKYWLQTENSQSLIPRHFATAVQAQIEGRVTQAAREV